MRSLTAPFDPGLPVVNVRSRELQSGLRARSAQRKAAADGRGALGANRAETWFALRRLAKLRPARPRSSKESVAGSGTGARFAVVE